jgi:hypothetical protein
LTIACLGKKRRPGNPSLVLKTGKKNSKEGRNNTSKLTKWGAFSVEMVS